MKSEGIQESHPQDPKWKSFVVHIICQAISQAQAWDEIVSGCKALANALRIAKDIEGESLRQDLQATASLDHLKALGREIRGYENGGSDDKTRQTAIDGDLRKEAQAIVDKAEHKHAQKREEKLSA